MCCTYIVGVCRGELHQTFLRMCPRRGMIILGSFSPKILELKNLVFNFVILRLYCQYLENVSKILHIVK